MEHHTTSSASDTTSQVRIPTAAWVLLAAVVIAFIAIIVFKVAVGTVITFGLIGLMMFSHLIMHGGHSSHSTHSDHTSSQTGISSDADQKSTHAGHGGCH